MHDTRFLMIDGQVYALDRGIRSRSNVASDSIATTARSVLECAGPCRCRRGYSQIGGKSTMASACACLSTWLAQRGLTGTTFTGTTFLGSTREPADLPLSFSTSAYARCSLMWAAL